MKPMTPEFESLVRRVPSDKPVRLACVDERKHIRCLTGRCIDVSSRQLHIEVREEIPLHTLVRFQAAGMIIAGSTSVKYVTRCDTKFILVLDVGA